MRCNNILTEWYWGGAADGLTTHCMLSLAFIAVLVLLMVAWMPSPCRGEPEFCIFPKLGTGQTKKKKKKKKTTRRRR